MTTPEWLTRHGGEARSGKDGRSVTVYFAGAPQYLLVLAPTEGKYGCKVSQSISGKRLDGGGAYPTPEAAFQGGFEDLRKGLGW